MSEEPTGEAVCDAAWHVIDALCTQRPKDVEPWPAPGQLVTVRVFRTVEELGTAGKDPLEDRFFVWGEEGPVEELDEAAYRGRGWDEATGRMRQGVFFQHLRLAPEGDDWRVMHAFGGSIRGHPFGNGVQHTVTVNGERVTVKDGDIWFG